MNFRLFKVVLQLDRQNHHPRTEERLAYRYELFIHADNEWDARNKFSHWRGWRAVTSQLVKEKTS